MTFVTPAPEPHEHLCGNKKVMKRNMGGIDKVVRIVLAIVIGVLYFTGTISGTLAAVLGVFAVVFLATSFIGTCPLYLPFGISTRSAKP